MKIQSLKNCLKRFVFLATTGFVLFSGMSVDSVAQTRGGRGPSAGGGVRQTGPIMRPGRDVVAFPAPRRGGIENFPTPAGRVRRVPDVDRRVEEERRERDQREREREVDETRRDVTRRSDNEANRFQKLGRWLGVSPDRLQEYYQQAKANNPDLRMSQFIGALVISNRLNGSNPNITPQAILRGLDAGMNIERTLVALGLSSEEAKAAAKWAERVVNQLKP